MLVFRIKSSPLLDCIIVIVCFTCSWPHLRCDVGLEEVNIEKEPTLCYSIMYHYNDAPGRLTISGFDLAWFSSLPSEHLCVFNFHSAISM